MTTLLDRDRSARTLLAVRASTVAAGLVASVGLQMGAIDAAGSTPSRTYGGDCGASAHPSPRAR